LREKFGDNVVKGRDSLGPSGWQKPPSKGIPGIIYSPLNKASQEYQEAGKDMLESSSADTVVAKLAS